MQIKEYILGRNILISFDEEDFGIDLKGVSLDVSEFDLDSKIGQKMIDGYIAGQTELTFVVGSDEFAQEHSIYSSWKIILDDNTIWALEAAYKQLLNPDEGKIGAIKQIEHELKKAGSEIVNEEYSKK